MTISIRSCRNSLTLAIAVIIAVSPTTYCSAKDSVDTAIVRTMDNNNQTIIISDMSRCTPQAALTRNYEKDKWQLHSYETENGIKGTMVTALPEYKAGQLELPLGVEGLYKIYLGIHYTRPPAANEHSSYGSVEVKLSQDKGFRRVGLEVEEAEIDSDQERYKSIHESYWKTADLTGQSLIIRQQQFPYNRYNIPEDMGYTITLRDRGDMSNVSYVKLVPLSTEEKRTYKSSLPSDDTRRLAAFFCTGQFTGHTRGSYTYHPTSKQAIADEFEPYANSDFNILMLEAMRGNLCIFNTKIGDIGTEDNRWHDSWIDPLTEFTKLAHANGMKILPALRMIGAQMPMNRQPISWARHYWLNPQWAQLDPEGIPASNWSIAFPQVRKYWISILRETLEYGTDGVTLYLHKGLPLTGYEQPTVSSFQKKYGVDPRKISDDDPRWRSHNAQYYTQFIREVRAMLDEKPGRQLAVVFRMDDSDTPKHYFDVETWLKEGLVDYLLPSSNDNPSKALMKKWRKIGGDDFKVIYRLNSDEKFAVEAKSHYKEGADGLSIWDSERQHAKIGRWAEIQQLGHIKQLDRIIKESKSYYKRAYLKVLDGLSTKFSYKEG